MLTYIHLSTTYMILLGVGYGVLSLLVMLGGFLLIRPVGATNPSAVRLAEAMNVRHPPTSPDSWRCRLGLHGRQRAAEGSDLIGSSFGTLDRCPRCGMVREDVFDILDFY